MKKLAIIIVVFLVLALGSALPNSAKIKLAAVDEEGKGILTDLEVEVQQGKGRVLVVTEPLVGMDTQNSERTAVALASRLTKTNMTDKDVIFTFHTDVGRVDGPSAGAAMVVASVAAISGEPPRNDVIITGAVDEDGNIGKVDGIVEKAKAAADYLSGQKDAIFLIPAGQRTQVQLVKSPETIRDGIYIEETKPVKIDVVEYANNNWALEVREVSSINQVIKIFFSGEVKEMEEENITAGELQTYQETEKEKLIQKLAEESIKRAEEAERGNSTEAAEQLNEAKLLFEKGYFYSAANQAFISIVVSRSSYMRLEEAKAEARELLAAVEPLVLATNTTKYKLDDLETIAAAQQRYVWAKEALSENSTESLVAAIEWLRASRQMVADIKPAEGNVDYSSLENLAINSLKDAKTMVENAEAIGAETAEAKRSLFFALKGIQYGLPLVTLFNSYDATALATSESLAGTIGKMILQTEKLQDEVSNPWALNYMKHSKYLLHKARVEKSRARVIDAAYLALRALAIENSFKQLPQPVLEENTFEPPKFNVEVVVFVIFLLAIYALKETADLRRRIDTQGESIKRVHRAIKRR